VLELDQAPWTGLDVIFCQNLLIYFRRWRRRALLNRLAERLAPGGLLALGVGEITDWRHSLLPPVDEEPARAITRIRECLEWLWGTGTTMSPWNGSRAKSPRRSTRRDRRWKRTSRTARTVRA